MAVDRDTFRTLLRPLCAMYGRKFDLADWTVYYQALADISPQLLEAAIVQASRESREFMPRPGELRALAEEARLALSAARPWPKCDACRDLGGRVEVEDDRGVRRLARCGCYAVHVQQLEADGIPQRSLLAGALSEREDAEIWTAIPDPPKPTALPPAAVEVLGQVKTIARAHRMPASMPAQTDPDRQPLPPRRTR